MWTHEVDEVLAGDQVVGLAYVTPANGVVVTPVTNFGLRDRRAGTLTSINSSVGVFKKLERIRRNPKVALAFHTRRLSFTDRPEYVLVQGNASLADPQPDYPRSIRTAWERFGGPVEVGSAWDWWLRVYNTRVAVTIAIERIIVWPDLRCTGRRELHGLPAGPAPEPQSPPGRGTGPRIDHRRAARRASRLPHKLLGWVGGDGFPLIVPVEIAGTAEHGIVLETPAASAPRGGRRAGLIAHRFARYTVGQDQRKHTGWMEAGRHDRVVYAPHTEKGYRLPPSMLAYRLSAGAMTRRGLRGARRAGVLSP